MTEFIFRYWLEAFFGLLLTGMTFYYRRMDRRLREQEAVKLGVNALLRDRIVESYNKYTEKGYCPIYAMENVQAMYKQYHVLGGNGAVSNLIEKLEDLPTEPVKRKRRSEAG